MISEVDLRDWDKVDFEKIKDAEALKSEYEYAGACTYYEAFAKQVLDVFQKQTQQSTKRIPALFRKGEE